MLETYICDIPTNEALSIPVCSAALTIYVVAPFKGATIAVYEVHPFPCQLQAFPHMDDNNSMHSSV